MAPYGLEDYLPHDCCCQRGHTQSSLPQDELAQQYRALFIQLFLSVRVSISPALAFQTNQSISAERPEGKTTRRSSSPIVLPHSSCLLSHPCEPHFSAIPAFCSHHLLFPCSSTTLFPSSPKPLWFIFINPPSLLHASISFSLPLTSPSHPRGPLTLSRDELVGWDRWEGVAGQEHFQSTLWNPNLSWDCVEAATGSRGDTTGALFL